MECCALGTSGTHDRRDGGVLHQGLPQFELYTQPSDMFQVYTLEKVLKLRKDHVSQVVFLDEAMKVLEDKPSLSFWHALARALEKQAKDATKSSTFLQQTLSSNYPKLLRLFHDFFAKIAVHTDTAYTQVQQRCVCPLSF